MGGDNIIIPNIIVIHEGDKMKVKSLDIKGIGGIRELSLKFNDGLNVICGTNGIGKTTILNIIADRVSFDNYRIIKRNAQVTEGNYTIEILIDGNIVSNTVKVVDFLPEEVSSINVRAAVDNAKHLLFFNTVRELEYAKLAAVPRDPERRNFDEAIMAISGVKANDIKGWFENRQLFSRENGFNSVYKSNLELSKNVFGLLDNNVRYFALDSTNLDIILETAKGNINFEYLSAGYKTCIYMILGIIKEIEFRFHLKPICAQDFDGVVLIDEIDLHLHPTWQARLVQAMKEIFPKAQFIVTTHSPSILQSLEKYEIIALAQDEKGNTFIKELDLGEYGLQGWTMEEILQDVMGMPSTTSEIFRNTMEAFDKAMMEDNIQEIKRNYYLLDKMLHPNSTQRKLLQIQMAGLEE